MDELKVNALVVRETAKGDYDKILTLITREHGKITVTGKGVKSLKSKNMAACQLFSYSSFLLRRSSKYYYIAESELQEGFFELKCDLERLALAAYVCDVASELSVEEMEDPELLRLTLNTLTAICRGKRERAQIKAAFELRSAAEAGFLPELSGCGVCGRTDGKLYLDVMNGRLLCDTCRIPALAEEAGEGGAALCLPLTEGALGAMQYITNCPQERFLSFALQEDELAVLGTVCEKYLTNHIEHGFYTLDFYKSLLI